MSHSQTFRPRAREGAFTLIELLTVIAIIGILAAILIPTVAKVRESAHQSTCASNVRQIALAILTYESENGVLPGPTEREIRRNNRPGENVPKSSWPTMNVDMSIILEDYMGRYHESDWGPFQCTSNEQNLRADSRWPVFLLMRNIKTNPPSFFGDMDFNRPPKRLEQIIAAGFGPRSKQATELTQIWMVSDIDGGNYGTSSGTGGDAPLTFPPPHNGGRNYAFFDGHVEYLKPDSDGRWRYPASTGDEMNHGH